MPIASMPVPPVSAGAIAMLHFHRQRRLPTVAGIDLGAPGSQHGGRIQMSAIHRFLQRAAFMLAARCDIGLAVQQQFHYIGLAA